MQSLDDFAKDRLDSLERRQLRRQLVETERGDGAQATRDGRAMISFSCNDYLNLSHDPRVLQAAQDAAARYGTGSGASRLVTGNHPLFSDLESRLAKLKGTEDACVFGSGYLATLGIIPSLVGPQDLILADEFSHACIMAGSKLSGARFEIFRHNDIAHAEEILAAHRASHGHAMILTDGVFSMDGDLAPVAALSSLAEQYDAWFMTDDAHGVGVVGGGRGSGFVGGNKIDVPLQMGTLSKAIGGYGGYLCASADVINLIRTRARTFIYTTGLPPAVIASAIAALDIIAAEPELVARPLENARLFTNLLGLPEAESCIVPVVLGNPEKALSASAMLDSEGYIVTAIRPPTVPEGTARLRFAFAAPHLPQDIHRLAGLVRTHLLGD
ncbi:MAG: 8-amino-7-oxononanoate synthase [Alphaproteobacteria bacterium]|nr:8-amino-7-oxononanoate synthase [Alphaproteobacteria bacterium]